MFTIESLQRAGVLLDIAGAVVMLAGILLATLAVVKHMYHHMRGNKLYDTYRRDLARSILLGLEFLVAGDILRTITTETSLVSVIALAVIVLIRSFLGAEFEMEITGRWPWQRSLKVKKRKTAKSKKSAKR